MAFSVFSHVAISAISAVVPSNEISLEDEASYYGGDMSKIKRTSAISGLDRRRVAPDNVTAVDLCAQAAERLFQEEGFDRNRIDAVIFVSQTSDYQTPASASILQHRLSLPLQCAAFDMNAGCSGFVHALWLASSLVASRAVSRVLVLVGDTSARFLDPANRIVAPVFGDAGTATLVEYLEDAGQSSFMLGNDGSKHEAIIIPGGGARIPVLRNAPDQDAQFYKTICDDAGNPWCLAGNGQLWMDGLEVFEFSVTVVPRHIAGHLESLERSPQSLDYLVLHHGNRLMLQTIAGKLGMAMDKVPHESLAKYGNLGAASIPVALCDHPTIAEPGSQKKHVMMCGFGAGLSWSSCLLSLEKSKVLHIRDFVPSGQVTRHASIEKWHKTFKGR